MLGRRIVGPREVILASIPSDNTIIDTAVDPASDLRAYEESLFDISKLKIIPGETPTTFKIRPLTRRQKTMSEVYSSMREKAEFFVRCACVGISNYSILLETGEQKECPQPDGGDNISSETWLDSLNLPYPHLMALGAIIRTVSEAQLPLSK